MRNEVVIPFYGGSDLLYTCLNALDKGTAPCGRVYVIDDASPADQRAEAMRRCSSLRLPVQWISLQRRSGFVKAVNAGWRLACADVVVILNTDTVAPANLIAYLSQAFERHSGLGAVAPASDNPYDLFQYRLSEDDSGAQSSRAFGVTIAPYLTAMCIAIRRDVVDGPLFDEAYTPGYFEDLDLCCRLRARGWQLGIVESCSVHHLGQATFASYPELDILMARNYQTFAQRWGHLAEHSALENLLWSTRDRGLQ